MTLSDSERRLRYLLAFLAVALLVLVYLVRHVLTPFVIAFALAYLLDPLVDALERWKLSRTGAVVVLLALFFLLVLTALLFLVPLFRIQVQQLAENLPDYAGRIETWIQPYIEQISLIDSETIKQHIKDSFQKLGTLPLQMLGAASEMIWKSFSSLMSFVMVMINLLIIPVAMFYLLRDFDRINERLLDLVPPRYRRQTVELVREIDSVLSRFVRGQLMVATLMALLYSLGLFLCGTPMSLFIGILAGYANLIPYLGLVFGLVPAALLTFLQFQDWVPLLGVAAVFGVVQALEGMVFTPRVLGDQIGLHPVAIMLAVLIGAELFGFLGVLLGVPAAAVLNVLRRRAVARYKASSLFK